MGCPADGFTPKACPPPCPPGAACWSCVGKPQGWKPTSPTVWTLSRAPAACSAFFRPELLVQWLTYLPQPANGQPHKKPRHLPGPHAAHAPARHASGSGGAHYQLWPAQIGAITSLEKVLAANKPKALIQIWLPAAARRLPASVSSTASSFGEPRRVLVSGGLGQPGPPDQERVRRSTPALQQLQVWRGIHRPAPAGRLALTLSAPRRHLHHPAHVGLLKGASWPRPGQKESTRRVEALF